MFEHNRSKKVELLAKVYDHAKHCYKFGFRMLTLGWSDGSTFLPVNSVLLSTENKKSRINEAKETDKRTVGYKRRMLAVKKGTIAMLELLKSAKKAGIPAKYVLFDSRFSSPSSLHVVKEIGYDVIAMVKKTPKVCKSYLNLSKECRSLSYDAMTAHTAIVFTRYMMLSLENRESNDTRSMRELFLYFSDEMSDITWIQAFQILLQMFRTLLVDQIDISDENRRAGKCIYGCNTSTFKIEAASGIID